MSDTWDDLRDPSHTDSWWDIHFDQLRLKAKDRFFRDQPIYDSLISYLHSRNYFDNKSNALYLTPEILDDILIANYSTCLWRVRILIPENHESDAAMIKYLGQSRYKSNLDIHATGVKRDLTPTPFRTSNGDTFRCYQLGQYGFVTSIDIPDAMMGFRLYIKIGLDNPVEIQAWDLKNICLPVTIAPYLPIDILSECPEEHTIRCHYRLHPLEDFMKGSWDAQIKQRDMRYLAITWLSDEKIRFCGGLAHWGSAHPTPGKCKVLPGEWKVQKFQLLK